MKWLRARGWRGVSTRALSAGFGECELGAPFGDCRFSKVVGNVDDRVR